MKFWLDPPFLFLAQTENNLATSQVIKVTTPAQNPPSTSWFVNAAGRVVPGDHSTTDEKKWDRKNGGVVSRNQECHGMPIMPHGYSWIINGKRHEKTPVNKCMI